MLRVLDRASTQSAHIFFLRFDSHAAHARIFQPEAPVFVPHGFELVRVRVIANNAAGLVLMFSQKNGNENGMGWILRGKLLGSDVVSGPTG